MNAVARFLLIAVASTASNLMAAKWEQGIKPRLNSPVENVTLESGRWHNLRCEAHGEQPITYKWYNQDGDEITGYYPKPFFPKFNRYYRYSELFFQELSTKHEGSYTCTASNAAGQASKVFFLTVPPPSGLKPRFDRPSHNVTQELNMMDVYIYCYAQGQRPMTYEWYKDGEKITSDQEKPVHVYQNFLEFQRLTKEQEGSYTCTARNVHGQASKVFFISVNSTSGLMKPGFDFNFDNVTLESGMSHSLECAAHGEKPITYRWYNKDGQEIAEDEEKPVNAKKVYKGFLQTSLLSFKRLSREHEGSYTCMASNANGQANKVFSIRVPPPSGLKPAFAFPHENRTLESGKTRTLECSPKGEKPFTYKWYNQHGDEITGVPGNSMYVLNQNVMSRLFFSHLREEQEGSYTCTASNANGQASQVFFLRVSPPYW